jgi:hypothetical protein
VQPIRQDIDLFVREDLSLEAQKREVALFARGRLAAAQAGWQSATGSVPQHRTFVDGRRDVAEEQINIPGRIVYEFPIWAAVIRFALDFLQRRSPRASGAYANSHFAMVAGGQIDVTALDQVSETDAVTITNDQPYARKIEVGHMRMSVPSGVYEDARQAVQSRFRGVVKVQHTMIRLQGGYVLKGHFTRGYKKHARTGIRSDTAAGQQVTYPALVITQR